MGVLARARARRALHRKDNRRVEASARLDEKTFARASLVDDAPARTPDASRASSRSVLEDEQAAAAAAVGGVDVERGTRGGGDEGGGGRETARDADACGTCRTRIEARGKAGGGGEEWTACEVAWARSRGVCALVARGTVYDASSFLRKHPSGEAPILRALGRDNTEDFEMHSARAQGLWAEHRIGRLIRCEERGYGDFVPPTSLADACVVQ